MKNNNTIAAYHIIGTENDALKLNTDKLFHWHIPKTLRANPIQKGDIVLVLTRKGQRRVLVVDVYREDIEDTGKKYKPVKKVLEKAPQ